MTGIEDFRWEEHYLFGPGDAAEHKRLRKTQPSIEDIYLLIDIDIDSYSKWMLFHGEDLAAKVKRISDNKKFLLGLSELKAVDEKSKNYQLLDDYAVWFVNNR